MPAHVRLRGRGRVVRVPELTAAAIALRAEGERLRKELHRRTLPLWATLAAVVALGVAGYFYVDARIEANARTLRVAIRADCEWYADIAKAPVADNAQELGRRLVRHAAETYRDRQCAAAFGPLTGVDPDAYRPAPPSPTR